MIATKYKTTIYRFVKLKDRKYPSGDQYLEFLLTEKLGEDYDLLDFSKMLRGKYKDHIKVKLISKDYTIEHSRRKSYWKMASFRNDIGHLSKMLHLGHNRYHGDFKGTRDKFFAILNENDLTVIVMPGAKHDYSLVDDFEDGLLDEEFGL